MPEWTAPFGLPDFTDDEYEKKKAEHVAREGYTITIPALEDVFKIKMEDPLTKDEYRHWKARDYDHFSPKRLAEIREMKAKRRERYTRMLADPTPRVVRNFQSIMTSLDDTQDALNTIGVVGKLAAKAAPKVLGRLLAGPVGVIMTGADILNLLVSVPMMCIGGKGPKQQIHRYTENNPFTKKGRVGAAKKLRRWKPGSADLIQGLQTTDQVFGFGVSLGPLVGLPFSLISGAARFIKGEEVHFKFAPFKWKHWQKIGMKMVNAMPVLWGYPHSTDDMELCESLAAFVLSQQALINVYQKWNPLDAIEDLDVIEIEAPRAEHPLTQEVILEAGRSLDEGIGWPSVDKQVASLSELHESIAPTAIDNATAHITRLVQSWHGWVSSENISNGSLYALALLEGKEVVEFDYICAQKLSTRLLETRQTLDPLTPYSQLQLFADELGALDALGDCVHPEDLERIITGEAMPLTRRLPQPT